MTITYPVKNGLYVNMTNRCPCACTFCLRQNGESVYGSEPLWLDREPTVEEVCADIDSRDLSQYSEVVFCGYGEPTERLDDLLKVAAYIKENCAISIRINTNGLSDLIHGERTAPKLKGLIDTVSVSLNATNAEAYNAVVRPKFGIGSYDAMLKFTEDCVQYVPHVVMTVVDVVTSPKEQERCRCICESIGATLRVRPYEE
ncbi:MAG: TIGR04100 family radical SAM protein [Clostridia bacterium]|nr:TIGR04100 family radical SAM protein [Clostridia bacterium]